MSFKYGCEWDFFPKLLNFFSRFDGFGNWISAVVESCFFIYIQLDPSNRVNNEVLVILN